MSEQDNEFEDLLREVDGDDRWDEENYESFPLISSLESQIIMHRDVHFGGKFEFMVDYYTKEGKGVHPEFDIERIKELYQLELDGVESLAGMLLTEVEEERIEAAKNVYEQLRSLYEEEDSDNPLPILIANLILTEEEEPTEEIEQIVAYQKEAIPLLIDLLRSEDFRDPLFPGYGEAPRLAARCLGMIDDEKSIVALFESIKAQDFGEEEEVLRALFQLGESAKQFLMKVVASRPITQDNTHAAVGLAQFSADPDAASFCLKQLSDPKVLAHQELAQYMIWGCEGLESSEEKKQFAALAKWQELPSSLKEEILFVAKAQIE